MEENRDYRRKGRTTEMLQIRLADEEDLAQIAALYVENWQTTYSGLLEQSFLDSLNIPSVREKWSRYIREEGQGIFAAYDDGIFLGFGAFGRDSDLDDCMYIESLHIAAAARGRGIGSRLINEIGRRAAKDGHSRMSICIVKGNDHARELYAKLGAEHYRDFTDDFGGAVSDSEKLIWTDLDSFR